jgi:hypothetical protein
MTNPFENTTLHIQFGDILEVNHTLITREHFKDLEFYTAQLEQLHVNFACGHLLPTEDHIITYINNEEYIDDEDIPKFILFVRLIFNKYNSVINAINKLQEKIITKQNNNFDAIQSKQQLRQETLQIKEQIRTETIKTKQEIRKETLQTKEQIRMEKKEETQRKKQEREEFRIYNAQVIKCDTCGLDYTRSTHANHLKSIPHIYRAEGITWMINNMRSKNPDLAINFDMF